jgi:glycosyltransferase involved in cell wall biosynthesis
LKKYYLPVTENKTLKIMISNLRIAHVITDLDIGGAEMMLLRLVKSQVKESIQPVIISLKEPGEIENELLKVPVPVFSLNLKSNRIDIAAIKKLNQLFLQIKPDLVHSWMYHADLFSSISGKLFNHLPLVWSIHNTDLDPKRVKLSTRGVVKVCALLSGLVPDKIVVCSRTSQIAHEKMGYNKNKFVNIPNGFDLAQFHPDELSRVSVRDELGLTFNSILIGIVARFDPQKDHLNFILAAKEVLNKNPDIHFILCGSGIDRSNDVLMDWINQTGYESNFHLLGLRHDIPHLMAAFDLVVSSSVGEAFPLAIGEAMSCGVPCVVTNVGDSAEIVGSTGLVVPPQDKTQLASAILHFLQYPQSDQISLGQKARERILSLYEINSIAGRYLDLYQRVIAHYH